MSLPNPQKPNPLDGSDYPLSPELEKERQKTEIPVSGKHMVWRIIAFVIALGVGITFIGLGIAGVFNTSSGLQEITVATDKEEGGRYGNGYHLYYFIKGSGFSTNGQVTAVRNAYTEVMRDSYKMYDAYRDYVDIASIHYLGTHPDEDVVVDARMYASLKEIYDSPKTRPHLFLEPLTSMWETLMASPDEAIALHDPAVFQENADYIASYLPILKDEDAFSLTFKANNKIVFHHPASYASWATSHDYDGSPISMGIFYEAARLDAVEAHMSEAGMIDGVVYGEDGATLSLGNLVNLYDTLLAYNGEFAVTVGKIALSNDRCSTSLPLMPVDTNHDGVSYIFKNGDKTYLRNLILNPETGYPLEKLASLRMEANYQSMLQCQMKAIVSAKDIEAGTYAFSEAYQPIYGLANEEYTLHAPSAVKDSIMLMSEYKTTIQTY